MKGFQNLRQYWLSIVALIFVILALSATIYGQQQYLKVALDKESKVFLKVLESGVAARVAHLSSLKGFFVSSNFIDRKEFKFFVGPILHSFPSIKAIGWVPEVTQEQRNKFTDLAIQDGLSEFSFKRWRHSVGWKMESSPWAQRYYPVYYLEPQETNLAAIGIDMGSHKQRRAAIDQALKLKTAVASNMVDLAQGAKGVLIFQSVESDEENAINSQQTKGLVSLVIDIPAFFKELLRVQGKGLIGLTAQENDQQGAVLFETYSMQAESDLSLQTTFSFLNQNWHLRFVAGKDFYAVYDNNIALYGFIAGIIFLMLVFKYNLTIISETSRIEKKVVAGIREITLKQQSLDQSQLRQKAIVDSMFDAVITIDEKGIIEEFNPAAEVMFGYQKSEMSGHNIKCLMPEPHSQAHDGYLSSYKKTKVNHIIGSPINIHGLHKDGRVFPVNLMVTEHKTGDTSMFIGTLHNLTEEQKLQQDQRRLTLQMESILDSTREGICGIGSDGLVRFANHSAERMLGYGVGGLDGTNYGRLIFSDSVVLGGSKNSLSTLEQAFRESGDTTLGAELFVTANGEALPISFSLCSMRGNSDEDVGFVLVFRDNTESLAATKLIKQQHQKLGAANIELSRVNKDMEQFAYVASHDLKAPLRAISNLAGWVCEDLGDALTGESLENMTLLRNRVSRLDNLLSDLLVYSRAGQQGDEKQDVNSRVVIQDLIDLQGVPEHVEVVLTGELPIIYTVRVAFDLIVRNLLGNAVKHAGRETARIEISAQINDTETVFSITDNGPGIQLEDHERIFELFTKLQSNDDVEGSGMGLSICRRAADRLGGRIWIDPELSSGARFYFSIPRSPDGD